MDTKRAATATTWSEQAAIKLRENPERLAWLVILVSATIFVILLITIPLGTRYVFRHATISQKAHLESTLGALRLYTARANEPIAVTDVRDDVGEGSVIEAAGDSTQGTLRFIEAEDPENALGSIQIYTNTSLEVRRIRRPLFTRSPAPYLVRFYLAHGQASIFTNSGMQRTLHVEIETPHGAIITDVAGAYRISVTAQRTDITVRSGAVELIHNAGERIAIDASLRAWMTEDTLDQTPVSEIHNLVRNGDFAQTQVGGRAAHWEVYGQAEQVEGVRPGSVQFLERDGRGVAMFTRTEGVNAHTEIEISQTIEEDVNIYDELIVQLDTRLIHQNLAGGGTLGSEFPLRVEIEYISIYGQVLTWGHGFYISDPLEDSDPNNDYWLLDRENNTQITPMQWHTYESPNLIELFQEQNTPIARINSIRIYASGHKYQSMVSEVYLLAR